MSPKNLLLMAFASTLVVACDGTDAVPALDADTSDTTTPPELRTVVTEVLPKQLGAGGSATVTCSAKDQYDAAYEPSLPLDYEVYDANGDLPAGVTRDGRRITAEFAGVFRVRCIFPGTPRVVDTSPVSVTVLPGEAASIKTSILKTDLVAGDRIEVACSVRDANNNLTSGETYLKVTPETGTTVTGGKNIRFTKVGSFTVACALTNNQLTGNVVDIKVKAAALAQLTTVLSKDIITPNEEVRVTCPGQDEFGNTVNLDKIITLPSAGVTGLDANRLLLTATKAGVYPITCAPKEAFVTATSTPAQLAVIPGAPTSITMDLSPDRTVFSPGARPRATARLFDAQGNEVSDTSTVRIEVRLGGVLKETVLSGEKATLSEEGSWTLSAKSGELSVSRTVVVDATAPTIDIAFPARGQMVTGTGAPIRLEGIITDATGGLASVKVNGVPRTVTQGQNTFVIDMQVSPKHGLNSLTVEATDVQGQTTKVVQTYLVSPGWKPASTTFPQGIIAHMSKGFIDDGNHTGASNDLATILEKVIRSFDIASYIPSPVVQYAGYDVYLRNVRYDAPTVSISPSKDQLLVGLVIDNFAVDVDAQGFIDVSGKVTADRIRVDIVLQVTVQNGVPRVTAPTIVVDLQGFDIDVHWSINWLINLFENQVKDAIIKSFTDTIRSEVPPAVQTALAGFAIDETFPVPAFMPGQAALNVRLQAKPDSAKIDEQGLDLALGTQVTAAKKVPWPTAGSMMRGGCFGVDGGMPTWDGNKKLTMALSLDVLNQVLHAVWQGGALEAKLGPAAFGDADLSQYGVSDLSVDLSAQLPPVLTDCNGNTLKLQLGELVVDLDMKLSGLPMKLGLIVAFETAANVTVTPDGVISIALGEIPPEAVLIDVTKLESELFGPDQEDVVIDLLREQLLGGLLGNFAGQGLGEFPLPELDLGGLSPALAGQSITVRNIVLGRGKGYLLLQGEP